jgi:geranylgeranyl diphosphate synthase type II
MSRLDRFLADTGRLVNRRLRQVLRVRKRHPTSVQEAMSYAVFAGGKRIRPAFCMAGNIASGGKGADTALDAACALELIHTYSLIHDDLPCMDDDDLRRGRPTVHRAYGAGIAVLVGDALHALAFELLAETGDATVVSEVAKAIGVRGMIGGQVADLEAEDREIDTKEIRYIHAHKTGALIEVSARCGAMIGGARQPLLDALSKYGRDVGLAFQIADDVLDIEGDTETLGKKAGADVEMGKATFPSVFGLEESKKKARFLIGRAKRALDGMPEVAGLLSDLADYVVERVR